MDTSNQQKSSPDDFLFGELDKGGRFVDSFFVGAVVNKEILKLTASDIWGIFYKVQFDPRLIWSSDESDVRHAGCVTFNLWKCNDDDGGLSESTSGYSTTPTLVVSNAVLYV